MAIGPPTRVDEAPRTTGKVPAFIEADAWQPVGP